MTPQEFRELERGRLAVERLAVAAERIADGLDRIAAYIDTTGDEVSESLAYISDAQRRAHPAPDAGEHDPAAPDEKRPA